MGNKCCGSHRKKDKSNKTINHFKERIQRFSLSNNESLVKSSPYINRSQKSNPNNNLSYDSKVKFINKPIQDDNIVTEIVKANTVIQINDTKTKSICKETNNDLKNKFYVPSTDIINYLGQDINLIRSKNKSFEDFYLLKTISSICESTDSNLFLSIRARFGCNSESGLKELNKLVKWQRTKV